MDLVYFWPKISDNESLVHDDGAVLVAPPDDLGTDMSVKLEIFQASNYLRPTDLCCY